MQSNLAEQATKQNKMPDDKFIFMSLKDDTKNIAEILKSDTAKKILDFLSDVKEASEKDISNSLNMPINTVEYNLKKLIKAGFVKPSKNFFWSVKGKKIPTYKVAKKHIIISPDKKPSLSSLKTILPIILIALIITILAFVKLNPEQPAPDQSALKQFKSLSDLTSFLKQNSGNAQYQRDFAIESALGVAGAESPAQAEADSSAKASEFSTTNIQVEGVDEADIVKNDDKYIYLTSNNKVYIINAYPAEKMEILSEIELKNPTYNIYINNDKLIVFSDDYSVYRAETSPECIGPGCFSYSTPKTLVSVYNIEDKENPELEDTFAIDGNYINSRMIGDYVYTISTKYINTLTPELPVYSINNLETKIQATEISYFPYPDSNYVFTTIASININNREFNSEVYLTGSTSTIYVSKDNIYLTYQKRVNYEDYLEGYIKEVAIPILPGEQDEQIQKILDSDSQEKQGEINKIIFDYSFSLTGKEKADFDRQLLQLTEEFETQIQKQMEKTIIHKINIDKDNINYQGSGEVPGRVLNQFSVDEYEDNLRITTTTGNTWQGTSLNHLYILDEDLKIIGSVEDLAKGEQVYSTRFLGERAYVVTFKQVDPLFVIDISKPEAPKVLGYLKVTGFSNYLHPYDENHIIGVGKEATEQGRVQGVKIALFDVSDVENPVEISKYEVGKEWSDAFQSYSESEALYEHKAFLFDKNKELLVLPISYTKYLNNNYQYSEYWQGVYVFNINLNGISLKGKIAHSEEENYYWNSQVRRSLYMDNNLYTISNYKIKANNLNNLDFINEIKLPEEIQPVYYEGGVSGVDAVVSKEVVVSNSQ